MEKDDREAQVNELGGRVAERRPQQLHAGHDHQEDVPAVGRARKDSVKDCWGLSGELHQLWFREHLLCQAATAGRGGLCRHPHLSKEQTQSQSLGPLSEVSWGGARIETQSRGTLEHSTRSSKFLPHDFLSPLSSTRARGSLGCQQKQSALSHPSGTPRLRFYFFKCLINLFI